MKSNEIEKHIISLISA